MVGHQTGDELMEKGRVRWMMGRLEDSQEERRKVGKREGGRSGLQDGWWGGWVDG